MKITKTRLKEILQEEIAAVQEDFGSEPPAPSATREEVNKVVAELFNVAANLQMLGEDFFSDYDSLDLWIGEFMEKHKVLQQGELEEGMFGLSPDAMEERTPMMPPKPVKIDASDMYEVSAAVRKFAAEAEGGDRDILEKAAEILQLHSGALEEGELEENFRDSDARMAKKMKQRDEERAKKNREAAKKAGGYYRADGTFVPRRD